MPDKLEGCQPARQHQQQVLKIINCQSADSRHLMDDDDDDEQEIHGSGSSTINLVYTW